MASSAKKIKNNPVNETQLQLLYGDDAITKYWTSSLFNTVYLRHDISDKHSCWKDEDNLDFQNFLNELRNIAADYKDREKELSSWSETETINNWVKRVLGALGWENNCTGKLNPYLEETTFRYDNKTYRTDILIVDIPNEKMYVKDAEGDKRIQVARESVLMPIEVKYWQRLEEYRQGKKEEKRRADNAADDIARTTTPNEQTVQYMDILKKSWGILTDGARWRLFNSELSAEDTERFYEFNVYSLFESINTEKTSADSNEIKEAAKYFYHFFSKFAFFPKEEGERPFVDEVLQYSRKYVNKVEEDLKDRFVKAMNIACNELYKSAKSNGSTQDLTVVRNVSESVLFNILFIKSLESRGVLPMTSTDYKKISLSSTIDKIEKFDPDKEDILNIRELERAFNKGNGNSFNYKDNGTELHDRILRLTGVIHKGASSKDNFGFEIEGFRESIFSNDEWQIFKTCKITNRGWVRILFELGYAESESLNRKYQQIPYAYFTPRQLGSIYEFFLEFKLDRASEEMVFEKKQWKAVDLASKKYKLLDLPKVFKGQLFFTPDNVDRKSTGTYYTPDLVVKKMVTMSLHEVVKNKNLEELKQFKVFDPAMGSAHFLSAALVYLSKVFLQKHSELDVNASLNIKDAKREVLKSCIFGCDINPRAVRLAKISLWLESAAAGESLQNLDEQLIQADSLKINDILKTLKKKSFDCILMNPPYETSRSGGIDEGYKEFLKETFVTAEDKFDYFTFFIESVKKYLVQNGVFAILCPDTILNKIYSKKIREFLLKEVNITDIYELGFSAFKQAVPTMILLGSNQQNSSGTISCHKILDDDVYNTIEKGQSLMRSDFAIKTWVTKVDIKLWSQCTENSKSLGDLCEIYNGIQTGDDKKYVKTSAESKVWQKVLVGSDVTAWSYKWGGKYIFYEPKMLHSNTRKDIFVCKEKIVIRQTADRIVACYDDRQYLSLASTFVIKPFDNSTNVLSLLAILNSDLFLYLYRQINNEAGRTLPQIKKNHIKDLPIVFDKKTWTELEKMSLKMIAKPDGKLQAKINQLVYSLYKIEKEEVKFIESKINEALAEDDEDIAAA